MKGQNQVWISGNVGGVVNAGVTKDNEVACSFSLASEAAGHGTTWVKVNAYGKLALQCQKMLSRGVYLSVVGELMNRKGRTGSLTEVRARDIVFVTQKKEIPDGQEDTAEGRRQEEGLPGVREQRRDVD